jgi:hypothetical protein
MVCVWAGEGVVKSFKIYLDKTKYRDETTVLERVFKDKNKSAFTGKVLSSKMDPAEIRSI